MHFMLHANTYLLPIQNFYFEAQEMPPLNESFVITSTNLNVITNTNALVAAKEY